MKVLKVLLGLMLLAVAFVGGFGYGRWYGPREAKAVKQAEKPHGYHCPMHPNFRSDKPGECGICGMRLVPDEVDAQMPATPARDMASMPMGTVRVSPDKQQLIGVRYGVAEEASGSHSFRAVGKVAVDETRIAKVQTKTEGWIDQVFVNFTGKLVEKGQPLLTLYSPELLASQHEYLLALKSREILKNSTLQGTGAQNEGLINAARKRLELWDLNAEQIAGIEKSRLPVTNITLFAPISGYVMTRNAFPKQRVMPDTELYTVVDLSRVWIMADVFENEMAQVREGMAATLTLSYGGGRKIAARVNYVQPQVDPMTRTLKVRLEAENPGLLLKPDMFVDVDFAVSSPRRVSVPADAVLDAGLRKTVFVDRGDGYLEPRAVETGDRIGDRIEILKGLKAGERVVTSGNFLIDSESQMRSAAAGMSSHDHGQGGKQ
ncbi:efflux RND transporter periplasmic adaptor subunit [uncultured Paludibaculum sp.]|uniref:efflux RND transporter periplasmic adaptor subunit n=1 Tax=uncultured Paludibaculum sp. TaxID=1765020 RepID=UPI002AAAC897|nr:efflux RND transporter periplasmic adaptor subunit [uncultured Paludibaculum sp.]